MIVCHPKQGSFWIHYSARSFAIYNPKERKPDAPRGEETGRLGEMKYAATKKSPRKSSPFSLSVSPSRELAAEGAAETRLAHSLARSRQTSVVNFSVSPRENRTSSREGMQARCLLASRVSTAARKKGVRSKKVREEFRRRSLGASP